MENLEKLKKKYEELGKKIERLENENKNKRWRAKKGEKYYNVGEFLKENLKIGEYDLEDEEFNLELNDKIDNFNYKTRNYFKTKEEAENYKEKLKTYYDLMDLADELNDGEKIDWKDGNQPKYFIHFNVKNNELIQSSYYTLRFMGTIYCLNRDFLNIALKRIGKEKLKKLFKGEK